MLIQRNKKLMNTKWVLFVLLILGVSIQGVQAQVATIRGTIYEAGSTETITGVNIVLQGTTIGTMSDINGRYELEVPNLNGSLLITFIGYKPLVIEINGRIEIDIEMVEETFLIEEFVVVGYGVQDSRDVTGAISSINVRQIAERSATNVFEAVQGRMSGVQITTDSGAPGEGAQIRVRGVSTFSGDSNPLYILDGQPVDNINSIDPNNIQSIEVLKDGASAAIYGSRSANGVVLITTKKPLVGQLSITANYLRSYSQARIMPVATSNDRFEWELFRGMLGHLEQDTRNHLFLYNNNFQEIMYQLAQKDEININLSSGSENSRIFWSAGFLNQEGVIRTTEFKRFNTTFSAEHDFLDKITVGLRTNLSYLDRNNINPSDEDLLIGQMLTKPAWGALFNPDGSYITRTNSYRGRPNFLMEYETRILKRRNFLGNLFSFVKVDLNENLSIQSNIGVDYDYSRGQDFMPAQVGGENNNITADFYSGLDWNWVNESYLNYNQTFYGDHKLSGVFGYSLQEWKGPSERISAFLGNDLIPTINNASEVIITNTYTLDTSHRSMASIFSRLNYGYKSKYLISSTFRRDGSSRFGPENRWGNFPAVSIAWRFSEEKFMSSLSFINDAKIRLSYAITGNERIGTRDYDTQLSTGLFYNSVAGIGLSSSLGNPAIKWEQTNQYNFGVDLSTLNGRLNFIFDLYEKNTSDLLANQLLPVETGLNTMRVNVGDVMNRGFEISIQGTPYDRNGFSWNSSINLSRNINKVIALAGDAPIVSDTHITRVGDPIGSFFGYKVLGVFAYNESNAFTDGGVQLTPNFDGSGNFTGYTLNGSPYNGNVNRKSVGGTISQGGDYNYFDLDGNFLINGDDRDILGSPFPKYYGGFRNEFSYNGINLSVFFDFQFNAQVYNLRGNTSSNFTLNSETPLPYILDNRWTGPGDDTAIFPGRPNRPHNTLGPRSTWIENADFIKLRNVRIGYTVPSKVVERINISQLSIYASINNVLTWTNYSGFDPEVSSPGGNLLNAGVDGGRYPRSRQFIVGFNINI